MLPRLPHWALLPLPPLAELFLLEGLPHSPGEETRGWSNPERKQRQEWPEAPPRRYKRELPLSLHRHCLLPALFWGHLVSATALGALHGASPGEGWGSGESREV